MSGEAMRIRETLQRSMRDSLGVSAKAGLLLAGRATSPDRIAIPPGSLPVASMPTNPGSCCDVLFAPQQHCEKDYYFVHDHYPIPIYVNGS